MPSVIKEINFTGIKKKNSRPFPNELEERAGASI